ncbi:MAG TPA: class II aldolase/adducin family protein [Caulobacteraceae bacterium]|jgi:L-fuculose-phosphate aldolase|nr:class II aldolase/adducin family protein [Caulobacteraceae bacterium]
MSGDEASLRRDLVAQYRRTAELRLNELASGNVSCRLGEGMLISPTGASAESISEASVVHVGANGEWSGDHAPSSEWQMHAAIYRRYADARAVVHTHSDYCVAVASHNRALPGFHYLVGVFGGDDVPCVPYATYGTVELGDSAAAALADRSACLLANHGMICRGRSLKSAVGLAHRLEIMCRQYVLARQLGEPDRLTPAQWEAFFAKSRPAGYAGARS